MDDLQRRPSHSETYTEIRLAGPIALLGRLVQPKKCVRIILWFIRAHNISETEFRLRGRMAVFG